MAVTPRNKLRGKKIVFTIGGTDYTLDATSIVFTSAAADDSDQSFAEAAAGGAVDWTAAITAYQSTEATALFNFVRTNAGSDVPFVFAINGNTTPSATQPHFTGILTVPAAGLTVGGDVNSTWTFDMEFPVVGNPVWKTAA